MREFATREAPLVLVGQILSVAQGAAWFFLLIHGGLGLIFGPMAWLAALVGRRLPVVSAALLIVPAAWLTASWTATVVGGRSVDPVALVLTIPAFVAAVLVLFGQRLGGHRADVG